MNFPQDSSWACAAKWRRKSSCRAGLERTVWILDCVVLIREGEHRVVDDFRLSAAVRNESNAARLYLLGHRNSKASLRQPLMPNL